MDWMHVVLPVIVVGVIVFQMRKAFRQVSGLARKLQDPAFVAKLETGDREQVRRELTETLREQGLPSDDGADILLERWHRARGTSLPAQPEAAPGAGPGPRAGLRFERAGSWPLLAALAVAALLALLHFQG